MKRWRSLTILLAWVIWWNSGNALDKFWKPTGGYETRADCWAQIQAEVDRFKKQQMAVKFFNDASIVAIGGETKFYLTQNKNHDESIQGVRPVE